MTMIFLFFLRYEDVPPQSVFRASTWQACGAAHHLASPGQAAVRGDASANELVIWLGMISVGPEAEKLPWYRV